MLIRCRIVFAPIIVFVTQQAMASLAHMFICAKRDRMQTHRPPPTHRPKRGVQSPRRARRRFSGFNVALGIVFVALLLVSWQVFSHSNTDTFAGDIAQTAQVGNVRVTLRLDQAAIGQRVIDLTVNDTTGQPVAMDSLRLRFAMVAMDMGTTEITAQPVTTGHFQTRGQFFTMAGDWSVEATLLREGQAPLQVPFTLTIAARGEASGPINPLQVNAQSILTGQKLYLTNCVACHGANGTGDGPAAAGINPRPADFTQHMVLGKHTDGQVFLWIKNGYPNTAMPAWDKRLTDEQIWQLVNYLRTFGQAAPLAQAQLCAAPTPAAPSPIPLIPTAPLFSPDTTAAPLPTFPPPAPDAHEPLPPIVFARESNIWRSPGNGGAPQPITNLLNDAYAEYPTVAPDSRMIAFVAITPAPITATLPLPTSTLYVMNLDGSQLRAVWKPMQGLLGIPTWSADGRALYIAANGVKAGQSGADASRDLQVVRVTVATGVQQPLLNDALDPTLSRDGKQLAYLQLSQDGYTMALNITAPDGSGTRAIIGGQDFQGFYAPRFSPDGKQIIVAAIGGPETDPQGIPIKASTPLALDHLLGLFVPETAEAHGLPWDLWVVNTDGTGLRRLTNFYEDLPMVAFSPDGTQVAVMGYGGIYLMNADGSNQRRIDPLGDHGGVDWIRGG
jgi:Tol biopolymer transport system component/mono/diheme cytochrome c family protein